MTRKEATAILVELKLDTVLFKKNLKGRAGLLREIKKAIRFINDYMVEDSTNALIVRDKKRKFDKLQESAYIKENQG